MGYTAGTLDLSILGTSDSAVASIDRTVKSLNSLSRAFGYSGKMFNNFFRLTRWTAVLYASKRIGNVMGDIVSKGSDFGETLNLWKVAMGKDFLPQATEFVNKLNEAYGISKETLMNSQAIFKNMLGSLGEISSAQAYALSEGITQMALDYASLYNVQFDEAMTKFQAALAGQVRPIRSVSGYDITENTLFQLYQELGGTKTMRQLSRTEKQLLAIYAVFEQMGRSGATGDLERTINSFANQSRVMADSWKDVQTYAGLTVTRILEHYEVMKYINAVLIFMSRILEGLATSLDTGLGNSGDVFGDMESDALGATEAVENLQNALLDFDKFRSLDQSSDKDLNLGLDDKIINALGKYDSILQEADLAARNLADTWIESLGGIETIVNNIHGKFNSQELEDIYGWLFLIVGVISGVKFIDALGDIVNLVSSISTLFTTLKNHPIIAIIGLAITLFTTLYATNEDFRESVNSLVNELEPLINSFITLANEGISPIISMLTNAFSYWTPIASKMVDIFTQVLPYVEIVFTPIIAYFETIATVLETIDALISSIRSSSLGSFGSKLSEIWSGFGGLTKDFWENSSKIWGFANGGLPDKGTAFIAGEAGAEIVYNMPSGQSGVANVQQIAQATYSGTMRALNDWWGGSQARGDIPQLKQANPTGLYEAVTGVAKTYGKVWDNA